MYWCYDLSLATLDREPLAQEKGREPVVPYLGKDREPFSCAASVSTSLAPPQAIKIFSQNADSLHKSMLALQGPLDMYTLLGRSRLPSPSAARVYSHCRQCRACQSRQLLACLPGGAENTVAGWGCCCLVPTPSQCRRSPAAETRGGRSSSHAPTSPSSLRVRVAFIL